MFADVVEAPILLHHVMQWYVEPATDEVVNRRRCKLLGT